MGWVEKTKERWGITSAWQFWTIMLVFSLAGSSIVYVRTPIFKLLGIHEAGLPWYILTPIYIIFIFPTYQVLLMFWGTLFGQFKFFWAKEKKMLLWFGKRLGLVSKDAAPANTAPSQE